MYTFGDVGVRFMIRLALITSRQEEGLQQVVGVEQVAHVDVPEQLLPAKSISSSNYFPLNSINNSCYIIRCLYHCSIHLTILNPSSCVIYTLKEFVNTFDSGSGFWRLWQDFVRLLKTLKRILEGFMGLLEALVGFLGALVGFGRLWQDLEGFRGHQRASECFRGLQRASEEHVQDVLQLYSIDGFSMRGKFRWFLNDGKVQMVPQ